MSAEVQMSPTADYRGALGADLDALDDEIDRLAIALDGLQADLSPVLREEGVAVAGDDTPMDGAQSQYRMVVAYRRGRISAMRDQVDRIRIRLEA